MADSDNSRTLPAVTRGDFHSFVAASLTSDPEPSRLLDASPDACDDDPALDVWREWCVARERLVQSCVKQQRLETKLFATVGSRLTAPEAWKAADKEVGYSEAVAAEGRAATAEGIVADTLWKTPAHSLAGATAKLHAIVSRWQPSVTSDEYPWPQLRAVIADLLKIDAEMSFHRNGLHRPAVPETRGASRGG
ncbi:hypothetical protein GOD47_12940 [Sinorhizobium medicae]|nr:hypothetical protein [Sinorhizobium medicae]MDX0725946.1 hypothetical protein [Sinorhizobium medicae]MDX0732305.1 hypothetical protein [Sinorhizobium medicae]MDX0814799.1 hypothetical protein [Sinorhizobium medicae]